MAKGDRTGAPLSLLELSQPDRARVEQGLSLLGRMVAQAYARDRASEVPEGFLDPRWIPYEEESRDAADD